MSYQPDLTNYKTRIRCEQAFLFANSYFRVIEPKQCSIKLIQKHFGNTGRTLGRWLLKNLIIEDSGYYNSDAGVSKSYTLNPSVGAWILDNTSFAASNRANVFKEKYQDWIVANPERHSTTTLTGDVFSNDNVVEDFGQNEALVVTETDWIHQRYNIRSQREYISERTVEYYTNLYSTELAYGVFNYKNKSYRYWHDLQSVKRDLKKAVLEANDYIYHYDISTAAPVILTQLAKQGNPFATPTIDAMLKHKTLFRNIISNGLGISKRDTKQLLSSLFYGARLTTDPRRAIMKLLKSTQAIVDLKKSRLITKLRREIVLLWKHLSRFFDRKEYTTKNGQRRLKPLTASEKSMLYFQHEQSIAKVIRQLTKKKQVRVFMDHDGWSTDTYLDPQELRVKIERATGLRVNIELELSGL